MRADGDEPGASPGHDGGSRSEPLRSSEAPAADPLTSSVAPAQDGTTAADRPSSHDTLLQRLGQHTGPSALVALATFATLVVGVLAAIPDWRDMLSGDEAPPAAQALRPEPSSTYPVDTSAVSALDLVVRDPATTGETDDVEAPLTPPAVEITVHNRGIRRSVITRVAVTVEDAAVISRCDAQGGSVPVSATYDVVLPPRPAPGDVYRIPVSQQQAADEADRFALRFGTSERATPTAVHLYRLRFDLEADGSGTRIPAGTAVVTLPLSLREGDGYFWSEIYDSGKVAIDPAAGMDRVLTCMKANSETIRRVLGSDAELSPDLAEVKSKLR